MKKLLPAIFIASYLFFSLSTNAQNRFISSLLKSENDFTECAAIFYEDKMLVDDYSPEGKCKLEQGMRGTLKVCTVNLSENGAVATENIAFKIAIKNAKTNTLWYYSDKAVYDVKSEDILDRCRENDKIIFMIVDRKYSLPHHEMEVIFGC